jgi:hypothetical protein
MATLAAITALIAAIGVAVPKVVSAFKKRKADKVAKCPLKSN